MENFRVESVARGYHVYKTIWMPNQGDIFNTRIKERNIHDRYAVAIVVDTNIVGHVPRKFSKMVYYFIRNGGTVTGSVCGRRKRSTQHMKGLEIPCIYEFSSSKKNITKLKSLLSGNADVKFL